MKARKPLYGLRISVAGSAVSAPRASRISSRKASTVSNRSAGSGAVARCSTSSTIGATSERLAPTFGHTPTGGSDPVSNRKTNAANPYVSVLGPAGRPARCSGDTYPAGGVVARPVTPASPKSAR